MEKSWQDALKAAMQKIGKSLPSSKKVQVQLQEKREHTPTKGGLGGNIPPSQLPKEQEEQSFSKQMNSIGVQAIQFKKTKVADTQTETGKQNISDNVPAKKVGKRVVKIQTINTPMEPACGTQKGEKGVLTTPIKGQSLPEQKTVKFEKPLVQVKHPAVLPLPLEPYIIKVKGAITAKPALADFHDDRNLLNLKIDGILEQLCKIGWSDEREIVIGLDFGTAFVKVVVGDRALGEAGEAFAVPFFEQNDTDGLSSYLLPSKVWLNGDRYTLLEQGHPRQNLKLNLINPSCDIECFIDTVGFLALVIRRSRSWLLTEHADIYSKIRILWKLTLGLPAATYDDKELVERFKKLAASAWLVAASFQEKEICRSTVERVCMEAHKVNFAEFRKKPELKYIDFDVVPELSAQIYGFLMSTKFDEKAQNIFMMADVGAGTVDSSVFRVTRGRGKKFQFLFYSNIVEFNGVANLHAHRINWLKTAFEKHDLLKHVASDINSIEMFTDKLHGIPDSLEDYFDGIEIVFRKDDVIKLHPDHVFYNNQFRKQVITKTLGGAHESCNNHRQKFKGMPVFLCGGGSRMKFYRRIEGDLLSHPNASWFLFRPQQLEVPTNLNVPGVKNDEFDRLSVAFGLSFLNVGEYLRKKVFHGEATTVNVEDPRRCRGCGAIGTCYCG